MTETAEEKQKAFDELTQALAEDARLKYKSPLQVVCETAAGALSRVTPLTEASIRGKSIGATHLTTLTAALKEPGCALQRLDLSGNPLKDDGAREVARMLRGNTSLTTLALENCYLGHGGVIAITHGLSRNKTLRVLDLSDNHLDAAAGTIVANYLGRPSAGLTHLKLGFNPIGEKGGKAIAASLARNHSLQALDLSNGWIGFQTCKELAASLIKNHSLKELDLHNNPLGSDGVRLIANALKTNTTLTKLNLANPRSQMSNMGPEGIIALSEALSVNTTLKELDVSGAWPGIEGTRALAGALEANQGLLSVKLDHSGMRPQEQEILVEALLKNTTLQNVEGIVSDELAEHLARNRHQEVHPAMQRSWVAKLAAEEPHKAVSR